MVEYPIYTNLIIDEMPKPEPQKLFQGAWYHKVISSKDLWLGIEGTFTLPEVKLRRYDGKYNEDLLVDPLTRNLETSSIYMGGTAKYESDVGLAFSKVYLYKDEKKVLSVGSYAYRPFWRYITSVNDPDKDIGRSNIDMGRNYSVSAINNDQTNMYAHFDGIFSEYYYLPGDKLKMSIHSPKPNFIQLQIKVIEKSKNPNSIKIRKENKWKDPIDFSSPIMKAEGAGLSQHVQYKRVNAIDQVGNEGKPIINTNSEITNAIWESVYLYRKIDDVIYKVPFNENRSDTLNAPSNSAFSVTKIDEKTGGSTVSIHPQKISGK